MSEGFADFMGKMDRKFPRRKLTAQQQEDIRDRYQSGEPAAVLALEFHVTVSRVRQISGARVPGSHR